MSATASPVVAETLSAAPRRCRSGRGRLRAAARRGAASRTPPRPTRPKVWDDNPQGNNAFCLMFGDRGRDRRGLRQGQACRQASRREQPAVARGVDGAARRHRRLRLRQRSLHALYGVAESARRAHGARHIFHVPENQMRVVAPDVGGGFGLKGGAFPDDVLVMWASKQAPPSGEVGRRPAPKVMITDHHGRDRWSTTASSLSTSRARSSRLQTKSLFQVGAPTSSGPAW